MGTIKDLNKIQEKAKKDGQARREKERKETEKRARSKKRADLAQADADIDKYLSEIKEFAKENPYKKVTSVHFGCKSNDYGERVTKRLRKEGFKVTLKKEYHKEEHYVDSGWRNPYTTRWVEVSWK